MISSQISPTIQHPFAQRVAEAANAVFGPSTTTQIVMDACRRFDVEVSNITGSRGINSLLIAIVGAKGQGKTWVARQLVYDETVKSRLRSGDLIDDATTRLVWIGPTAPERLDANSEIFHACDTQQMVDIGRPYVLLDTPGSTDANQRAAEIASEALSLAPIKLLIIARDQIRSAASISIAQRIDGSECIPVISSVEPDEFQAQTSAGRQLRADIQALRAQIATLAPRVQLGTEILVPDFEISGDEDASQQSFRSQLVARLADMSLDDLSLTASRESRLQAAEARLRRTISKNIAEQMPQLAAAVDRLNRETETLPERVLDSLLGSPKLLDTGVRMRLRSQLVGDTYLLWFPYRTLMSLLNMTQGAWDRVMLAMAGSVPSLFGALATWARNVRQSHEFNLEVQDGIRERMQRQVEERLKPLCDQFHRAIWRLRTSDDAKSAPPPAGAMHLSGIEELQDRSRKIFEQAVAAHATRSWVAQTLAIIGMLLFWGFMAGPIVAIYHQYFSASYASLVEGALHPEGFPHPHPSLIITSVVLSLLPLVIYAMIVLTLTLSNRKIRQVSTEIQLAHTQAIEQLRKLRVIQLEFEDRLLQQAEFLLNLSRSDLPVEPARRSS
ncbi:MAG: hypothetical protein IT423_02925 [Pirellulaceae bacterium]|nr:hypothetical protein [Pirellulaceae bacterium]